MQRAISDDAPPAPRPVIDEDGILRVGRRWAPLSDSELELLAPLLADFGKVVSREVLQGAASRAEPLAERALNVRITRLRHRIEPLGLRLINVRKRGYILDLVHDVQPGQHVYERDI